MYYETNIIMTNLFTKDLIKKRHNMFSKALGLIAN